MEFSSENTNTMSMQVYMALGEFGVTESSRNGPVLKFGRPVLFEYTKPWQRVNMDPVRDANPFFHLMEGLAMMFDINSVEFLSFFNSNIHKYSDDGYTFNSFYGTRMLSTWGNQLEKVIDELRCDPRSRRAVIQLWDPADLSRDSKDKACNMSLVFGVDLSGRLTMTINCRSNDLIWGGVTGANIVHFSMIMEMVAIAVRKPMGSMYHFVNDAHVYTQNLLWDKLKNHRPVLGKSYVMNGRTHLPLGDSYELIQHDLADFFNAVSDFDTISEEQFNGEFFNEVAAPMYNAWVCRKNGEIREAYDHIDHVDSLPWHMAAINWMDRRDNHED